MRVYESFEQIEADLKLLSLEKQIGLEELKLVKSDFQDSLKPLSILASIGKFASKYGALILLKKIFR